MFLYDAARFKRDKSKVYQVNITETANTEK